MQSILDLAKTEGMLFKYGSGTGSNLSTIRSSKEALGGGGTASGPVSFMKGFDAFAGVIKSGGKTRRAAKMVILNVDHPDIVEFINCKQVEERKAWALIDAGYDGGFNVQGGAYDSIFYQNANHSVRVTDDFMQAVVDDKEWATLSITGEQTLETYRARDLMRMISESTWVCGDPGMQYDTTINDWHTCSATDRINASNPCSEYMFLDNTACNLASMNLMKYYDAGEERFDAESFRHACEVVITAQEIIVDTPAIRRRRSRRTRIGSVPWESASPISGPCSWREACPTTPTRDATMRVRSALSCRVPPMRSRGVSPRSRDLSTISRTTASPCSGS